MNTIPQGAVLVPLRTCAQFYTDQASADQLRRLLKQTLILHDDLAFERDVYVLYVTEKGESCEFLVPSRFRTPGLAEPIVTKNDGSWSVRMEFALEGQADPVPIFEGKLSHMMELDLYPILKEAGIAEGEEYIHWFSICPTDTEKACVDQLARNASVFEEHGDAVDEELKHEAFRIKAIRNAALCSRFAASMNAPFVCDGLSAAIMERICAKSGLMMSPEVRSMAYSLIEFPLPRFGDLPWDKVLEARNSGAGVEYRSMVKRIAKIVMTNLGNCSEQDLRNAVQSAFNEELLAELCDHLRTTEVTKVDLALNFASMLPFVGNIAGTISSMKQVGQYLSQGSWLNMLQLRNE